MNNFIRTIVYFFIKHSFNVVALNSECQNLVDRRLSRNVIPHHYDLTLHFNFTTLNFNGFVAIFIDVKSLTNEITLNSKDLDIMSAHYVNDKEEIVGNWMCCKDAETITLKFPKSVKGKGKLRIKYRGKVPTRKVRGIYAVRDIPTSNVNYTILAEFEPKGARTAYPCFDEPNMKATFSMSIIAPKDRITLSNMPAMKNVAFSETETKVIFEKTPRMSTYITCMVIGYFDFVEQQSIDGRVRVRVYTPVGRRNDGSFALSVAVKSVEFLQNYHGVPYPLPKLDLVSVRDFGAGALENWGLIVFIENDILIPKRCSISHKQEVATVVSHEVTHQWFGNLVTLDWWTHTWLNEGFANFFENYLMNIFFKEWNYYSLYLINDFSLALDIDSLESSHPIAPKSISINDISDVAFDTIVYSKGGAIINMMKYYMGEEDFKKGLNKYLQQYQYGTAKTIDILKIFDTVSGKQISSVMKSWFTHKGYPLIKVSNNKCLKSELKQKIFLMRKENNEDNKCWKVPIIYSISNYNEKRTTLLAAKTKHVCSECAIDWNVDSIGFYRVQYTSDEYKALFKKVKRNEIPPIQRFSLQNDYFALVKAGKLSIADYLEYLKDFKNEDELFVWKSIVSSISEISAIAFKAKCSNDMKHYTRSLMSVINERLKRSTASDDLTILLRVLVYRELGLLGDKNIVENAMNSFDDYNGGRNIDVNYRSAIFEIVASNAKSDTFSKLLKIFNQNANDAVLRREIIEAMGAFNKPQYLRKTIQLSTLESVTTTESVDAIMSIARNPYGRELAWKFFKQNFELLRSRTEQSSKPSLLIKRIVTPFDSSEKAVEIKKFFEENHFSGITSTLKRSLEIVRNKENWYKRDSVVLCSYLKKQ